MNAGNIFENLYALPIEDLIKRLNTLGVVCCPPSAIKRHLILPHVSRLAGASPAQRPSALSCSSTDGEVVGKRVQAIAKALVYIMLDADVPRKLEKLSKLSKSIEAIYKSAEALPPAESLPIQLSLASFLEVTNSVSACISKQAKTSAHA